MDEMRWWWLLKKNGDDGWMDFWERLKNMGILLAQKWENTIPTNPVKTKYDEGPLSTI